MLENNRQGPHASYNLVITVAGLSDDGMMVRGSFFGLIGLENEVSLTEY